MPRPLLHSERNNEELSILSAMGKQKKQDKFANPQLVDSILRKNRSKAYMDALAKLDANSGQLNEKEVNELIDTVKGEFPDVDLGGFLQGFVAKCYLGGSYEVHTLDFEQKIVTHYHQSETLPGGLEKARSLAKSEQYAYIEVYSDCCRCVDSMGTVAVIKM